MNNNTFGTIAEVIDVNHYGVVCNWGQRVEAVYYRTALGLTLEVGDRVFMEWAKDSQIWLISGHVGV